MLVNVPRGEPKRNGCLDIRGRKLLQQAIEGAVIDEEFGNGLRQHAADEPIRELRGRDEWVRIGWDEALDIVAGEFSRIREEAGNEGILQLGGQLSGLSG